MAINIHRLEDRLVIMSVKVGAPIYDFDFDLHFLCDHPYRFEEGEICVLRIGSIDDYPALHDEKTEWGLSLINSPNEHRRASDIEVWHPLIADLTPRTRVYDDLPSADEIEPEFGWPVFVKGTRQTSRHKASLAVAHCAADYLKLCEGYRRDPILSWQRPAIRQFVSLDPVKGEIPGKLHPSREFRSFWWRQQLVGYGQYWYQLPAYRSLDIDLGLAMAQEAADRVRVPFLVVDIARKRDGGWIVIECNDAQESGYAGLPPQRLWRNILDLC